jgi:hypothetical protein
VDVIAEIWRRTQSTQPAQASLLIALTAGVALFLVVMPGLWPITRILVTITHEGAHAFSAVVTGRRLQGIRLHSDTSGLTVSRGKPAGPGMIVMLAAGYLGPAVVGVCAALMLAAGLSLGLLWSFVIVLALMVLQIRNFYGLFVVVLACAGVAAISWYLSAEAQSLFAYLITWVLLIAAPKPVLELIRQRRRGRGAQSDADQLARLTRVPGAVWTSFFLLANLVALVFGAILMVPGLSALSGAWTSQLLSG